MDIKFLYRTLKASLVVAILVAGFSLVYGYHSFAKGFFLAALWSIVNLWFICILVSLLFTPLEKGSSPRVNKTKTVLLVLLKFPVLYTAGYIALRYGNLSIYAVLAGFSLVFLVIALKAAGYMIVSSRRV
ncbi:MAG: hypothetical protein HYY56_04780 [Candidatus Omnitrophica bacterium]|nr:hypothetical protein [Candidatus Omnitrophota bacterium]